MHKMRFSGVKKRLFRRKINFLLLKQPIIKKYLVLFRAINYIKSTKAAPENKKVIRWVKKFVNFNDFSKKGCFLVEFVVL